MKKDNAFKRRQRLQKAIDLIRGERRVQDEKWGDGRRNLAYTDKPDPGFNLAVLTEEVGEYAEALVEGRPPREVINELKQVAAVATAIIEQILRQEEAADGDES